MKNIFSFLFIFFLAFTLEASLSQESQNEIFLTQDEKEWLLKHPTIHFAGDPDYIPFEGYDKNGNYTGIAANYLAFIEKKIGIKFNKIVASSWQDTTAKLNRGEVDMITNYVNDGREETSHLMSKPFYKSLVVIVKTKDKTSYISDLGQLEGKKIGVVQDYTFVNPVIKKYPHLNYIYHKNLHELFEAVSSGKIDAVLASITIASYEILKHGYHNLQVVGETHHYLELGFEIKEEYAPLLGIINKVLASMTPQEHSFMVKEWVDLKIEKEPINYPLVVAVVLFTLLIIVIFFYWNKKLKRNVEKKTFELSRLIRFFDENVISSRTDLDGNITDASSAFCRISGNTKEYLMGKNHRISKHPDNDPKVYDEMWKTISEGKIWKGRVINKKRNGGYYWVDSTIEPEYDINGKKIGYISIRHDVTAEVELKKLSDNLEETIKERTHELSLLSSQNEAIFQSATIGILLLKDRKVVRANDIACQMLGYSPEEILGNTTRGWYLSDEDFEYVGKMYALVVNGDSATWEKQFKRKNGEVFWVRSHMKCINKYNFAEGIVATIDDISVEKQRFLEIEVAKKIAEDATRTKSAFLANMSHEIRTPMNAIIGMTHLAISSALDAKQKNYLQKIDTAAKNLLSIINDILDFSKIESGKMSFEEIEFSLEDVLENVSNLNILKIQNKGLELLFDMDAALPTLFVGDPLRLEQVLTNLVSNAVKFTENGEIKIKVELIEKSNERCELEISVSDTGIGLTAEQIQNLFRAFSQADSSTTREYGGTGLGLTISKYLVEQMQGKIWVESEHGKGSSFIFRVKLKLQEIQKDLHRHHVQTNLPRVLVVDDNEAAREILESMLTSLKFDVATASGGEEAIAMLHEAQKQHKPFELTLIDWIMPTVDGLQTIRMIREDNKLESLPAFIMMTVYDKDELIQKSKGLKIDGFIAKPVTPSTLFDTIVNASNVVEAPKQEEYKASSKNDAQTLLRGAYILLVEDNTLNQEFALEVLEKAGVLVDVANNGKEAYEMAKNTNYDGILMDCQMPVMDGYEATRLIRESSNYPKVPILALSANAMESDKKLSLESGMNDHISKPIDVRVLFETMAKWIEPAHVPSSVDILDKIEQDSSNIDFKISGLELKNALERAGDDITFLKKMLKRFAQTQGVWAQDIDNLLTQNKVEDARRETHTLKGLAGNIGAVVLFNLTKEIEEKLKNVQVAGAQIVIPFAKEELAQVIENIIHFFEHESSSNRDIYEHHTLTNAEIESLKHDIKELLLLLDEFDSEAVSITEKIAPLLKDLGMDKEVQELMININNYEFEAAKEILLRCKI